MKELIQQLSSIPDAYDDFILGTINYVKKDPSHIDALKDFMIGKTNLTSSDIIAFIITTNESGVTLILSFRVTNSKEVAR